LKRAAFRYGFSRILLRMGVGLSFNHIFIIVVCLH
jgi:hypothetical protein